MKRALRVIAIVGCSFAAVALVWFGAGFFFAPDNMVYQFESHLPEYLGDYVVLGDNAWHWYPWGLAQVTRTELGFRLPTFERALAEAIVLDQLYEDAVQDYEAPHDIEDLEGLQHWILQAFEFYLKDWGLLITSAPDKLRFDEYHGVNSYRMGGYYANPGRFDVISINEQYQHGKRWSHAPIHGTFVHELIHAQGPPNAELMRYGGLRFYGTLLNHHNESITQLRTLEVVALMRRYGHENYEATYYSELKGIAFQAAYYLMMRERGCPWTDYPLFSSIEEGWGSYLRNEQIGRLIDEGEMDVPPVGQCHTLTRSFLEDWVLAINDWLHTQHTKNWERDFETTFMALYPSTPERRAYRRMRLVIREQNPYWWSVVCYKYWYVPYFQLQVATGNDAMLTWSWHLPVSGPLGAGTAYVPLYNSTSMLNAVYYYRPIQEEAQRLLSWYPTKWVLYGLKIEEYEPKR